MGSEVVIVPVIFGSVLSVIFGILYFHYSTRNKERLALIEKGADASIFNLGKRHTTSIWKVFILNLSVLLMGIGVGIFIASFLHYSLGIYEEVAYPGTIFLMAGIGLFTGFTITKKLDKQE